MDRQTAKEISQRAKELLAPLEGEFGVKVRMRGGSYGESGYTFKTECNTVEADGTVKSRESETLRAMAQFHDLPDDCVGAEFSYRGEPWILTGMAARAQKNPFIATRVRNGKSYRMPEHAIEVLKTTKKPITPSAAFDQAMSRRAITHPGKSGRSEAARKAAATRRANAAKGREGGRAKL